MIIYVSNQSKVVSEIQFQQMITAMNQFLITLCSDWSITTVQLFKAITTPTKILNNTIFIFDDSDSPGALGYHFDVDGFAVGKVFAKTILQYGGAVLYKNATTMTVAQCLCHEALEMIGNANINKWYLDNSGVFWAGELCDAVENNLITITIPGSIKVALSDYVLPNWFSPNSTKRPFNKLNTLTGPFKLDRYGYSITIKNNRVVSVYGQSYPDNKKADIESDVTEIKEKFGLN
jgi:hypothetical protein